MAHSRFWAYPENLGDLKIYEYAPDFKAAEIKDIFSDCGEGVVARHCPSYELLPLRLRLRYRARWLLGKSFFSGTREVASGLVWDESRFYFLSLSEGAVYAFDKEGTDPLWVSDAATGYACDSSLVPVGEVLYLACRHDLGRKWSIFALDAKTGEPLAGASLESELSALIPGPEGVLVILSDGSLWKWSVGQEKCAHFLDLGDAFHRVSDFLPGPLRIEAPWTYSEALLILGGKTNVWVIDPSAGLVRWKTPVSGVVRGLKASATENRLWAVTSAAEILTLELSSGVQLARWEISETKANWYLATLSNAPNWGLVSWNEGDEKPGQIIFCDYSGICYGFDTRENRLRWAIESAPRHRATRPFVAGERLFVDAAPDMLFVVPGLPLEVKVANEPSSATMP